MKRSLVGGLLFGLVLPVIFDLLRKRTRGVEEEQANAYYPVQSDSEQAAGHPIVGVS